MTRAALSPPRWLLVTMSLTVLTACSTRDHDNPLDPENPATGGEPRWLTALADDGAVDLSWDVDYFNDVETVELVSAGNGAVLWSGDLGPGAFRDVGLVNGQEVDYRLDLVLTTGVVTALPEESATPGRAIPWAYDLGSANVSRLTPDGRRERLSVFDPDAVSVVADPESAFVLVLDFFRSEVVLLDRDGDELWTVEDLFRPGAGLWSPEGWWVSDAGLGLVALYDHGGSLVYSDSTLTFPAGMTRAGPNAVWVADRVGPVVRIEVGLGVTAGDTLDSPLVVSEVGDGGVWVADVGSDDLVRLQADGTEVVRVPGFFGVATLAADPVSDGAWVGDRGSRRVVLVDGQGQIVVTAGGFPAPSSLAVSPDGNEIWVADPARGKIVRIDRTGEELSESEGLSSPVSVSVAFDPSF